MPEGPEIRRAADRLADAVVGQKIVSAFFAFPALAKFQKSLVGRRIEAIAPHGKALLTRFDNGHTLYSHNQLYGVWRVARPGERPDGARSLRVALETADRAILLYSASDVQMWLTDDLATHPFLAKLGPDVLDPALRVGTVVKQLRRTAFAGKTLTALLLDQSFLAGMGNYLRSEVLFEAAIAPQRRPRELDDDETRRLAQALIDVPTRSYRTQAAAIAAGAEDFLTDTPIGFAFMVFDREGERCLRCGKKIVREELGGRRLYWCKGCQH
jgi:endonuclease VIII